MRKPADQLSITRVVVDWWKGQRRDAGLATSAGRLVQKLREFLRDSLPDRKRQRYGDVDYDWDHRVDTTSATVGWRERLLGVFLSPYQATEPGLFREIIA